MDQAFMVYAVRCEQNVQAPSVDTSEKNASVELERAICSRERYWDSG